MMHGGLSAGVLDIGDVVAEGDKALVRLETRGRRHTGEFMGAKSTSTWINIDVTDFFHVADGRLVEHWALMDNLSCCNRSAPSGADRSTWSGRTAMPTTETLLQHGPRTWSRSPGGESEGASPLPL